MDQQTATLGTEKLQALRARVEARKPTGNAVADAFSRGMMAREAIELLMRTDVTFHAYKAVSDLIMQWGQE